LADALVPAGGDPVEWFAGRSTGGGDFEFARLYLPGQPQEGLAFFETTT
jgi:hypothetical protein